MRTIYISSAIALGLLCAAGIVMATTAHAADTDVMLLAASQKSALPQGNLIKITSTAEPKPLEINPNAAPNTVAPEIVTYTVQPGDSLAKIAADHNLKWTSIYQSNDNLVDPDVIYAGMVLTIPAQDMELTKALPSQAIEPVSSVSANSNSKPGISVKKASVGSKPTIAYTAGPGHLNVGVAMQFVGYPYVHGGNTPSGFDCSGFVQYVAGRQGISLPRTVTAQYAATQRVSRDNLQAGDLVFFNRGHVGIYIGGGQIIHAATPSLGVRTDSLASAIAYNGYWGAGRI